MQKGCETGQLKLNATHTFMQMKANYCAKPICVAGLNEILSKPHRLESIL